MRVAKGGKLGPSQDDTLLGHSPLSSDTPTMKMKAVDNRYNSYGSKYEACTRLSWVARGNIRWPKITGNPPPKATLIGLSYICFLNTTTCFRIDILGSALVEFI